MACSPRPSEQATHNVQEPIASTSMLPEATVIDKDDGTASEPAPIALSKNQQKKLARQAKILAERPERRARERAARKENKAEKRRRVDEEGADPVELGLVKKPRTTGPRKPFNANIVIDLSFDDKMQEKEIKSMSTQLSHVYSVNRNAERPVSIIFTPLDGQLRKRMDTTGGGHHLNWKGVKTLHNPLEELWSIVELQEGDKIDSATSSPNIDKESVVYLTADSQNVLRVLEEGKTYIIGGIVDHNRYKNLCLGVAEKHSIQHAALPIGEYIEMASRKVLTVNQCFEIMSRWLEHEDWERAFYDVIPKRKFQEGDRQARSQPSARVTSAHGSPEMYDSGEQEHPNAVEQQ